MHPKPLPLPTLRAPDLGSMPPRHLVGVLGAPIDVVTATVAVERIADWASRHESRVVCICNAHSVVTATRDTEVMRAIAGADMATPDGAPVAWMMRNLGATLQQRVSGPDLMLDYCARAAISGESIFLYGGSTETLKNLQRRLRERWPKLSIAGALSPPFRSLTQAEDADAILVINASGAGTVWVSLGCPKQELWMAEHRGVVNAVMVGVGAAFDFHAGTIARAPRWMREHALEWLYRLLREPGRLGGRYLTTNTMFLIGAFRQLLDSR